MPLQTICAYETKTHLSDLLRQLWLAWKVQTLGRL